MGQAAGDAYGVLEDLLAGRTGLTRTIQRQL